MAEHSDGSIIIDTELDTSGIKTGINDTRQKLTGLSGQFKELGRTIGTAFGDFRPIFNAISSDAKALSGDLAQVERAAQNGLSNAGAVLNFHSALDKAEKEAHELALKLDELGRKQLPTHAYTMYEEELKKAREELAKLIARQDMMSDLGVKESSAQWKRITLQIEQTQGVIIDLENDMQALRESGDAFTLGSDTAEYKALSEQLEAARSAIDRNRQLINSEKIEQAQLNVLATQEAVITAKTAEERTRALEKLREAQAALQSIASQSSVTLQAPETPETSKWEKFRTTISGLGKEFVKIPFRLLASGAKAAANGLKSLMSRTKQTALTAKGLTKTLTSLKTILISRLKRTFISAIINGVKEGINALAQFSSEFDGVMSNIKNRSKELSANLSVSVGSFISAVEPLITTILEALSQAVTYLNAFIGMLQGKSTITVAKKQTDSYAKSLDNATDSAKELKAQIYGFDDLNKASSTSDSSKTKDNAVDLFEEKSIEDLVPFGLLEMLEKIKNALLNGEWRNAGQLIGEGLNAIIQTVDDFINGTLRPKGVEWAANIAELLNGIVDTLDFRNIGKTIADGINTIADILNTFLTTFDFVALGKRLGEGINGLFENIEWGFLGETFANHWNALIDLIYGLVTSVKWDVVGDKAAEFVQSFADNLKIEELADAIGIGLDGIITLLQHFLDGVNWDEIATRLGDGVNRIFGHIDWPAVGKLLSDGFIKALSFISTAIETVDWFAIGADVSHALNAIDWPGIFGELSRTLSDLFVGALDLLLGCVEELDWFKLGEDLWDSIIAVVENVDWNGIISRAFELLGAAVGGVGDLLAGLCTNIWEAFVSAWDSTKSYFDDEIEAAGGDIWKGIGNGILKAIVGIGTWILDNILTPFAEGFSEALGFASLEDLGVAIYERILKPISDFFETIETWIKENILDPFVNGFKRLFGIIESDGSEKWNELVDKVKSNSSDLENSLASTMNNIKDDTTNKWELIKSNAIAKWTESKNNVVSNASNLKNSLASTMNNIKIDTINKWEYIKSNAVSKCESLKTTAVSKFESLKSAVSEKWSGLRNTLRDTEWYSSGENLISGLRSGIENKWDTLVSTVQQLGGKVTETLNKVFQINSPSRAWAESGKYLDAGLNLGIQSEEDTILRTVSNLARSINKGMAVEAPTIGRIDSKTVTAVDKLSDRFDGLIDRLTTVSSMLHDLGTFTMPALAVGSLVPYAVHANTFSPYNGVTEASDALHDTLNDQGEVLSEIMYLLGQILTVVRTKDLSIDAGVLTETVTRIQKKKEIDYGGF